MGGYIRMDKDLGDDPRVLMLRDQLVAHWLQSSPKGNADALHRPEIRELACNAVLGALYRLWRYGDSHLGRYNRLKSALHGAAGIAEITGLPESLVTQFPPEWLRIHMDGRVELPDYSAKNALIDRDMRREKTRERVRRWRQKQRDAGNGGNALHKDRQEALQRYERVTTGTGTGTGTGTEPTVTGTGPGTNGAASRSPATAGSAAQEPTGPLSDTELRHQVELMRALGWNDPRILEKFGHRGMTEEHLRTTQTLSDLTRISQHESEAH